MDGSSAFACRASAYAKASAGQVHLRTRLRRDKPARQVLGALQTFFGKGSARRGLQVAFEIEGLLAAVKSNGRFDSPRPGFGGVGILSGIVFFQSASQIPSESDVESVAITLRLKDVNIMKSRFSIG